MTSTIKYSSPYDLEMLFSQDSSLPYIFYLRKLVKWENGKYNFYERNLGTCTQKSNLENPGPKDGPVKDEKKIHLHIHSYI